MKAWRPNYGAVAIYIGGPEMGCGYGNLSKGWVQSTEGMGWSLMPIYVGPQATCNSFSDEIVPSQAAAEGTQSRSWPPPTRPASVSARGRRSNTTWRATTMPTTAA
jgi:Rv2525c-like, glycoside hydrolase-like domain